jgi:hypothetical protein
MIFIQTITKFTRETAFKLIFHQYMRPPRLIIIISTLRITIPAENNENPVKNSVTTKITARERLIDDKVSCQMVKYCS